MAKRTGVHSDDLDDFRRDVRAAAGEIPQRLEGTSIEVAQMIALDARARAYGLGGVAAKTAPTVHVEGAVGGGSVALGGASAPYAGGAEFGGQGSPTTMQFRPWKGGPGGGYFLYPAIRDARLEADAKYVESIDNTMRKHDL